MYGTQTHLGGRKMNKVFENDVKMYGTQTVVGRGVKQCTV